MNESLRSEISAEIHSTLDKRIGQLDDANQQRFFQEIERHLRFVERTTKYAIGATAFVGAITVGTLYFMFGKTKSDLETQMQSYVDQSLVEWHLDQTILRRVEQSTSRALDSADLRDKINSTIDQAATEALASKVPEITEASTKELIQKALDGDRTKLFLIDWAEMYRYEDCRPESPADFMEPSKGYCQIASIEVCKKKGFKGGLIAGREKGFADVLCLK